MPRRRKTAEKRQGGPEECAVVEQGGRAVVEQAPPAKNPFEGVPVSRIKEVVRLCYLISRLARDLLSHVQQK